MLGDVGWEGGLHRGLVCSSNPPTIPILDCSYHRVVTFDPTSNGQVALVIYEWNDVPCLGVTTPDNSVGGVYRPVRL
jgi:hypothetical protein